jgi:hypothetical protein
MSNIPTKSELKESLEKIYETITSNEFLWQKWLWNEIPFYIYDYPAKYELLVRNYIKTVLTRIQKNKQNLKIIEIDLYELMIHIIKDKWLLEKVLENEKDKWTNFIEKALKPIIKPENFNDYIEELSKWVDIIFLTWIWKIYPLVRSHTILNNLHHIIPWINLVMFFPWEYTRIELKLFSKLKDDNYYRAFRLNINN